MATGKSFQYTGEMVMMQICVQPPGKFTSIPVANVPVLAQNVSIPASQPPQQQYTMQQPQQQYTMQQPQQQYTMQQPQQQYTMQQPQQQYTTPQQQQQYTTPQQQQQYTMQPTKPVPSYIATRSPLNPADLGPSSLYTSTMTSSQLGYPSDVSPYYAQQ